MSARPPLSRRAVRELDARAIEECGVPGLLLMESAGRACAEAGEEMLADRSGEVVLLIGPGNNGGDGLVIARTLANRGHRVRAVFVGPHERLEAGTPDFDANLRMWRAQGGGIDVCIAPDEIATLAKRFPEAALVVDALFGTGLTRPLGAPYPALFDAVARSGARVLAVDVPSGLDADSGEVLGAAIRADRTVTFVAEKPGLRIGAGPEHTGTIHVAEIGIPRFLIDEAYAAEER